MRAGDCAKLNVPYNPWLHGRTVTVVEVTEYGAVVRTGIGSGVFRALSSELEHEPTGDFCSVCGGMRMRRSGSCLLCEDCGTTTGCG